MAKVKSGGEFADDAAKQLAKFIGSMFRKQAVAKTRYAITKKANIPAKRPSSPFPREMTKPAKKAAVKKSPAKKAPAKKTPAKKTPAKKVSPRIMIKDGTTTKGGTRLHRKGLQVPRIEDKKGNTVFDLKTRQPAGVKGLEKQAGGQSAKSVPSLGTMGGKTTKTPKKRPERPASAPSLRGKSIPQSPSEQKAAEKSANWWLKNQNDLKPQTRPDRVPQSPAIPQAPSRSRGTPLGPRANQEAEQLRREAALDRRRIGPGQPSKGGKNKSGSAQKKQSSKNNPQGKNKKRPKGSGGANRQKPTPKPTGTSRSRADIQNKADIMESRIQARIDSAKTPAERKKWEQRKRSLAIEKNANLYGGRGKYSG